MVLSGTLRDEIARILEQVAKDGLGQPRDLDVALDAIGEALGIEEVMHVVDTDESVFLLEGHDEQDACLSFGPDAKIRKGYFVEGSDD